MNKIFVEGDADKKFIQDYLNYLFGIETKDSRIVIDELGGKDALKASKPNFNKNTELGGRNLVIFDADDDCETRREELLQEAKELGIPFELFLFPNNQENGNLETLLRRLTVADHEGIFDCFIPFNECLKLKNPNYDVPNLKLQLFSYLSFRGIESKEKKRNYLDIQSWRLDDSSLIPLRDFLKLHIDIPGT